MRPSAAEKRIHIAHRQAQMLVIVLHLHPQHSAHASQSFLRAQKRRASDLNEGLKCLRICDHLLLVNISINANIRTSHIHTQPNIHFNLTPKPLLC